MLKKDAEHFLTRKARASSLTEEAPCLFAEA